ncbi:MAG TPA: hypothetical protein VL354_21565 [Spirochaetia bacterium]|nr:hypothetical protein [Spirochaetia bacterium]
MQVESTPGFRPAVSSIAITGQERLQRPQLAQASASILTRYGEALPTRDWKAPKGQKLMHWTRCRLRMGSTITNEKKSSTKMSKARKVAASDTTALSVISLNGQSQAQ